MVEIDAVYDGDLRTRVTHGPTGAQFTTDAPKDHEGRGEAFAPTDLVAAAMGSCVLTVMGIVARRHGIDLSGTRACVEKEMVNDPARRIARLTVIVTFGRRFDATQRARLERAAMSCPVHHSLHPDIHVPMTFVDPA